jgi:hypothetical protein
VKGLPEASARPSYLSSCLDHSHSCWYRRPWFAFKREKSFGECTATYHGTGRSSPLR